MTCLHLVALLPLVLLAQGSDYSTTTHLPTSDDITKATTTNDGLSTILNVPIKKGIIDASKGDYQLQQDLELLLDELRQVASAIHEVRSEHGTLAKNVADMSVAVKDMSERNMHIRKKVRKMSKVLNKSTHHHKYKDGLRALQRDHQKILHAMSSGNVTLNMNRTGHHHHHHHGNITDIEEDIASDPMMEVIEAIESTNEPQNDLTIDAKDVKVSDLIEESEDANLIPELVVEPPGGEDVSHPRDCREVMSYGNYTSGIYTIQPEGLHKPIKVWCDQKTEGGGWTVLVARMPKPDDQLNFSRPWNDYKFGFGVPSSEYWIGNEALHLMTSDKRNQLRVNITDWNDSEIWADWREFSVASEQKQYELSVSRYVPSSTAGDALKWHNAMKFSTVDRDNDALMGGQCAKTNQGGWWYRGHRGCYQAHPTGRFQSNPGKAPQKKKGRNFDIGPVLVWQNWRGESYYPKTLFLMFRPVLY